MLCDPKDIVRDYLTKIQGKRDKGVYELLDILSCIHGFS
jgi:hypothetical protein